MNAPLVIATANVLRSLTRDEARASLRTVLAHEPDLVGLQEWGPSRRALLRETGPVTVLPWLPSRSTASNRGDYTWYSTPLGGCAVGARTDRFRPLRSWSVMLDGVGRAERPDRWFGIEPPRFAAVATYQAVGTDRRIALVSYHLVSGVQEHGTYRNDWPRLVRRHRREVERLQHLVDKLRDHGFNVHAVGDSNFDGLRLSGLTSAWEGRRPQGTLGRRAIDDVFGVGPAASVRLVETPSDHRALIVTR